MYYPATWVQVLTDVNLDSYSLIFFDMGASPAPLLLKYILVYHVQFLIWLATQCKCYFVCYYAVDG